MVAARSANQAPDVAVASELGSLLHAHVRIKDPRWRLDAIVRLVPALRRFGISIERFRHEVGVLATRALCPRALREVLRPVLVDALERGSAEALARLVNALFARGWHASLLRAVEAALALDDHGLAWDLATRFERRYLTAQVENLIAHGFVPGERFAGCLRRRGAEDAFAPSLPLVIALVDAERAADAERLIARLRPAERAIGIAHLARLDPTPAAARVRLRSIAFESTRQLGGLLVARSAIARGKLEEARTWASWLDKQIASQRVHLEIGRALVQAGCLGEALRELKRALHSQLWAEQLVLRTEIRLVAGRPAALRTRTEPVWMGPAWTHTDRCMDVGQRRMIVTGVGLLYLVEREGDPTGGCITDDALRYLGLALDQRAAACDLLKRCHVDLPLVLLHLCSSRRDGVVDALVAEQIAQRAATLDHTPAAMPAGAPVDDPRTIDRAVFDEALALSPDGARRRRVLIAAAQHCVRSALAEPAGWDAAVVETRLRTLVHLGGTLGTEALRKALETHPPGMFTPRALESLCLLDAEKAAEIVLARGSALVAAGIDIEHALQVVETHHGVPRGFAHAYRDVRQAIQERSMCRDPDRWLTKLVDGWRERHGRLPAPEVLDGIAERVQVPRSPATIFDELDSAVAALRSGLHIETLRRITEEDGLLSAALLAAPARVDPSMRAWPIGWWRQHLEGMRDDPVVIDARPVRAVASALHRPRDVARLRCGDLPALGVEEITQFSTEDGPYRVRLLDKCSDILTYLRFADVPAYSCFSSRAGYWHWAGEACADTWRDPLTFVFHIERARGDAWEPRGFFFGGFVELEDEIGVAFNSLHVRPALPSVRLGVIEAVEQMLCRPLRIRTIGLANMHGGRGPIPATYAPRTLRMRRIRALIRRGAPVSEAQEDICSFNQPTTVTHLWWRTLE